MKERGIIFNGDMVRAILNGRKTQTRRVLNPQPVGRLWNPPTDPPCLIDNEDRRFPCPYGQPGDRLYVRETWALDPNVIGESEPPYSFVFKADENKWPGIHKLGTWKPSIHMPKWAARIWLEITDVRVERLQDISEEDAAAEGIESTAKIVEIDGHKDYIGLYASERFHELWDAIYGTWNANPWVWVITFKKL